jgi:hypothetical protein
MMLRRSVIVRLTFRENASRRYWGTFEARLEFLDAVTAGDLGGTTVRLVAIDMQVRLVDGRRRVERDPRRIATAVGDIDLARINRGEDAKSIAGQAGARKLISVRVL